MIEWIKKNALIALVIAVLLAIVFGSAIDGCRARASLQRAEAALAARDAEIAKIREERNKLKTRLDGILERKQKPWEIPESLDETATRFRNLGY